MGIPLWVRALAFEAIGKANAEADPYSAVNAALMPILSDRIANQRTDAKSNDTWRRDVTKISQVSLPSRLDAARLNTMLHLASSRTEELKTGNWGAVTLLPVSEQEDAPMRARFNVLAKPMFSEIFCLEEKNDRRASRLCILRVGASCDYAQSRPGPIPFMLGAIVPAGARRRERSIPKAEIVTPSFFVNGFDEPVRMIFNTHLTFTMVPIEFEQWQPLCRLREQLLMQITTHGAQHSTRPAIISFRSISS